MTTVQTQGHSRCGEADETLGREEQMEEIPPFRFNRRRRRLLHGGDQPYRGEAPGKSTENANAYND